jgi:hypothetical protein
MLLSSSVAAIILADFARENNTIKIILPYYFSGVFGIRKQPPGDMNSRKFGVESA